MRRTYMSQKAFILISGRAGSGKDWVANTIFNATNPYRELHNKSHPWDNIDYADTPVLKKLVSAYTTGRFVHHGQQAVVYHALAACLKSDVFEMLSRVDPNLRVEDFLGPLKEKYRPALQYYGNKASEIYNTHPDSQFREYWCRRLDSYLDRGALKGGLETTVLIPDVRYLDELRYFQSRYNTLHIHVARQSVPNVSAHHSEDLSKLIDKAAYGEGEFPVKPDVLVYNDNHATTAQSLYDSVALRNFLDYGRGIRWNSTV